MIHDLLAELKRNYRYMEPVDGFKELRQGFSEDLKYVLQAGDVPVYLLRLSLAAQIDRRKREHDLLVCHHRNGVRCPKPYAFGVTPDGKRCFSLLGFIEGESAERVLPDLPIEKQRRAGFLAGAELWKLHRITGDETRGTWLKRRREKYQRRKREAGELGLTFHEQDRIERFIDENIGVLENSPVRFQHDDFHVGNLIMKGDEFAGVIDFNRTDWGDPVEDFYKIPWFSEPVSRAFAIGQIEGYLARERPDDFWPRYNLFVAMNFHGSLVYENEFAKNDPSKPLQGWQDHIAHMVQSHDFKGGGPPTWFVAGK